MWFKQPDSKSPQHPEPTAARQQTGALVAPAAPLTPEKASEPATPPQIVAAPPSCASRITPGLVLKGEITGREDLAVDGEVEGSLRLAGARLVLGVTGSIRGDVEAREIVVGGHVIGNLRAEERLEITRTGNVSGDAIARRILVEDGAVFNGTMEVAGAGEHRPASIAGKVQEPAATAKQREGASATPAEAASGAHATSASSGAAGASSSTAELWKGVAVSAREQQG
jgi:cytoskeletal protein CcmA (bactofilin family)